MAKRTTEEASKYFREQGCELLEEYVGAMHKMKYRCSCGEIGCMSWNNFTKGKRCGNCAKHGQRKKRSLEEVQKIFKERGCEFLDKEFNGIHFKHNYRCKCGKECKIRFAGFHYQNQNCKECGIIKQSGTRSLNNGQPLKKVKKVKKGRKRNLIRSTKDVSKYFNEHGCELLDEYVGCIHKMKYKCHCGEIGNTSWNNFTKGKRCGNCTKYGQKKKRSLEEVQKIFKERNCEFLDEEFKDIHFKHNYRCKCGKCCKITFAGFYHLNQNCKECGILKQSGKDHWKWREDRSQKRLDDLFRKKCYKALRSSLKATGKEKVGRTSDILGYGTKELQEHIRNHENWDNVKDEKWQIDHIFPIAAFVEHGIRDLALINHLDNLMPLNGDENLKKSDKYDKKEFLEWVKRHGK